MTIANSLNVSELLKRMGVSGDSLGSAPLLDALRLTVNLADFKDLIPPLAVPMAGVHHSAGSGVATFNKWTLNARSPGGLRVNEIMSNSAAAIRMWISATDPFVGSVAVATAQMVFGQTARSVFFNAPAAAAVAPAGHYVLRSFPAGRLLDGMWVGPGEFFNLEGDTDNIGSQLVTLSWTEYPAALNP